jgi:hypothetical protein
VKARRAEAAPNRMISIGQGRELETRAVVNIRQGSEIVRTNNNAPLVTLCNCEERCRLQTSAQKDQRIRALSRTPLGDDGLTPPLGKPERFGDSDIRGIGDSQRKVLIRIHQVGDPRIIGARQVDGSKVSISQRRAGRLLIVSLLLPGQARQGSG